MKNLRTAFLASAILCSVLSAQTQPFDVAAYRAFLSSHASLTAGGLSDLYPAGSFVRTIQANPQASEYFPRIDSVYRLTDDEEALLGEHGFVVSQRLRKNSFGQAFADIYHADLPVFVSSDAILHALHMSYDAILKDVEIEHLIPALRALLDQCARQLPDLAKGYASDPSMKTMINDVDVYLSVARILLDSTARTTFPENASEVAHLLDFVRNEKPLELLLFSSTPRAMDFSQFTVRGHYTDDPRLSRYFRAMIWLGRTELRIIPPSFSTETFGDAQRQAIDAALIAELIEKGVAMPHYAKLERTLTSFVGAQDNITLAQLNTLFAACGINKASKLLDSVRFSSVQDTLRLQNCYQLINSQMLENDPFSPEGVQPAAAFLLLGQRFIVDSYVTGNVVYDRVQDRRMLPSPLDILFSLGNDAAGQLLRPELDTYHYAPNLAALRYLIDGYDRNFWETSIYNGWLNAIRTLNPPKDRTMLPRFMQTAAWWQEKVNTQLSSWAQLRHDNLLYAKQSYTSIPICSFPESYVEPIPEFFRAVANCARIAQTSLQDLSFERGISYFRHFASVADTLEAIAAKTRDGIVLTDVETTFLRSMLRAPDVMCGATYDGWYPNLFYNIGASFFASDLVVADVHTSPADADGIIVGFVLHGGTGPVELCVVTATAPDGRLCSFVGPVMSYYEHVSVGFKRLTDEEWASAFSKPPSLRPSFVNAYAAGVSGNRLETGAELITGVMKETELFRPNAITLFPNYPNPFNSTTTFTFSIPYQSSQSEVVLAVYSVQGQLVRRLMSATAPPGLYSVRWDGTSDGGRPVASGVYFVRLIVGGQVAHQKLILAK